MNKFIAKAIGIHNLLCAVIHVFFPKIFQWEALRQKLPEIDAFINHANLNIMNYCMLMMWLFFSWAFTVNTGDVLGTRMGRALVVFMAGFWAVRVFVLQTVYVGFPNESIPPVIFFAVGLVLSLVLHFRMMTKRT
jgi:hypothetical protein